eukprot:sb/3465295/
MEPHNPLVKALLTDFYQITMAYAYWKCNKHNEQACFDLYFRKNPFKGEFTIFCGLEECVRHVLNLSFSAEDINYLRTVLPQDVEEGFVEYLLSMDCSDVTLTAIPEGSVVFPREPLIIVEGPLAKLQILETTLLNLVNFASLVATNAARFRLVAGKMDLLEFGLRRAQGPDGGISASRYCYIGGFDGTSNVLAAKMFNIPCKGTNAHSFITSFTSLSELDKVEKCVNGSNITLAEFTRSCLQYKDRVCKLLKVNADQTIEGELASFIAYALTFPKAFLVLVDSYDVFNSGVPNFIAVALALQDLKFTALGVRIDSGDLAYQSLEIRKAFELISFSIEGCEFLPKCTIVGSNDICEETIASLNQQGHSLDALGVGTHLVTCKSQPALGCVFKLTKVNGVNRIKK